MIFSNQTRLALTLLSGIAIASFAKPACSQTPLAYAISPSSELPPFATQTQQINTPLEFSPVLANLELAVEPPILPEIKNTPPENAEYIIAPRIIPNNQVNPFTTTLPLNSIPISHLTEWEVVGGYNFGDTQNDNFIFDGIVKLKSSVTESLTRTNILTLDQKGTYAQLRTVRQFRAIDVTRSEPQTLTGLQIQLTAVLSWVKHSNSNG